MAYVTLLDGATLVQFCTTLELTMPTEVLMLASSQTEVLGYDATIDCTAQDGSEGQRKKHGSHAQTNLFFTPILRTTHE